MNFLFLDNIINETSETIYTIKGRPLIKKLDKIYDFEDDSYLGKLIEINSNININILPDYTFNNQKFIICRPISINNQKYLLQTLKNIVINSNLESNIFIPIGKIIYSSKGNIKFIKTKKI